MKTNKSKQVQGDNHIPLRWSANEQRQKAKTTRSKPVALIPLQWRGGNEVDGVVSMVKK